MRVMLFKKKVSAYIYVTIKHHQLFCSTNYTLYYQYLELEKTGAKFNYHLNQYY